MSLRRTLKSIFFLCILRYLQLKKQLQNKLPLPYVSLWDAVLDVLVRLGTFDAFD